MNTKWSVGVALIAALAFPMSAWAHGGHAHKVMGTVSAVTAKQLDVKTTDGKTVMIALDAKTIYRQGKAKVDAKVLKVGDRVVVEAVQEEGAKMMSATTVQMAAVPAAAKK